MKLQTDKVIEYARPDIVLSLITARVCNIADIAYPFDTWVLEKEMKKMGKYQDLKWEIKRT